MVDLTLQTSSRMLTNYFARVATQEIQTSQTISKEPAGCSKRPSGKAAASEEAKRTLGRTFSP
jgi:hypothetical protein